MKNKFQIYGFSDIGLVRKKNEDVWIADPAIGFFALADGIGGHKAGEIAAKETIQHLNHYISSQLHPQQKKFTSTQIISKIQDAISRANSQVYFLSKEHKSMEGMGTTVCMIYFFQKKAYLCHVGDSRVYLFRNQKLKQLTFDHSLLEEFRARTFARGDANIPFSLKNVITQAIGVTKKVTPEISSVHVKADDIFFLCSDGLTDFVVREEILNILESKITLKQKVTDLINKAKSKGSNDNITILMLKIL